MGSLTITIVAVSIVSVALVGAVVYFTMHRRRLTSPFRHRRMNDDARQFGRSNNMEFANRMFLQDDDEDESGITMEELEPSRNFVNPVYETMFQECQAPIIKNNVDVSNITSIAEQTTLLKPDDNLSSSST